MRVPMNLARHHCMQIHANFRFLEFDRPEIVSVVVVVEALKSVLDPATCVTTQVGAVVHCVAKLIEQVL